MGMTFVVGRPVTGYDEGPSAVLRDGETVEADLIWQVMVGWSLSLYKPSLCVERRSGQMAR
jgi:hypothetical protein